MKSQEPGQTYTMPRQCSHSILQPFSPGAVQLNAAYFHNFTAVHFAPYRYKGCRMIMIQEPCGVVLFWAGRLFHADPRFRGRRRCPVCSGYFFEVALDLVCQSLKSTRDDSLTVRFARSLAIATIPLRTACCSSAVSDPREFSNNESRELLTRAL